MKRILFVCSHPYSGSSGLCDALNRHPRIQGYNIASRAPYTSVQSLIALTEQSHKLTNRAAIYMDELLSNHQLSTKIAYQTCKFIYVIREPENVLTQLVINNKIKPEFACRTYLFRLRRLCEMAKRTNGVLLTWDDLKSSKGLDLIEEYLDLRQKIQFDPLLLQPYSRKLNSDNIGIKRLEYAEEAYQKYLYWLKSQTKLTFVR